MSVCDNCDEPFELKSSTFRAVAYCSKCRSVRNKDLMELIYPNTDNQMFTKIEDAEAALTGLSANVRLDLHKTLDTVSSKVKLPYGASECCCISFVGQLTVTRVEARNEIIQRIKDGQISFGALVFKRGSRKKPEEAMRFVEPGSKAWFNSKLPFSAPHLIFVDDSDDHVESVKHAIPLASKCLLIKDSDNLIQMLVNTQKPITLPQKFTKEWVTLDPSEADFSQYVYRDSEDILFEDEDDSLFNDVSEELTEVELLALKCAQEVAKEVAN